MIFSNAVITPAFIERMVMFMAIISAETVEKIKKYTPEVLNRELVEISIRAIAYSNYLNRKRIQQLQKAYDRANSEFELYKRNNKSNNWLKTHGYPMRRRRRV